ncbi:MAG TPA: 16S rRNA (cytosine(1402)-N(4))-methyltransferase RsmH [Candidatus Obscuribacterales bacterium]
MSSLSHYPVMCKEVLEHLDLQPGSRVLDCTVGGAGHSSAILERIKADGFLWGIERDPRTFLYARERLAETGDSFCLIQGNFADLDELALQYQIADLDAVLLDLGTSLFQLREAERGFSFMADGPLDMRMNPEEGGPSAAVVVNTWSEAELKELFQTLGEERFSGRIARAIVSTRRQQKIERTVQLAELIAGAVPKRDKLHPATRVFQALRIAVNDELGALKTVLPAAVKLLRPGGRIAVIAFHSLEDRIVKQSFRHLHASCICPPRQPICTCQQVPLLEKPGKALFPSDQEVRENPPSRSARLRVAKRL